MRISPDEFLADIEAYDAAASASRHVDRFCSTSFWTQSAHVGLMGEREPVYWRSEAGWAALARREGTEVGVIYEPLEAMWGFASPFVGPRLDDLAREVIDELAQRDDWGALVLTGIDLTGPVPEALLQVRRSSWRVGLGVHTRRCRASLEGGFDGFLARRSRSFRANLRRTRRRADREGVELQYLDDVTSEAEAVALYERMLDVEARSWKGLRSIGIDRGRMERFYREMVPRLARRGALRAAFARREGNDLAYHLGGVLTGQPVGLYRGLQHSFDQAYRRLSLGTLVHAHVVERVCHEGLDVYDLGQQTDYKADWSEGTWDTHTLVILRRPPVSSTSG